MESFQKRLVVEKSELDARGEALWRFMESEAFMAVSLEERERLRSQVSAMWTYSNALSARIRSNTEKAEPEASEPAFDLKRLANENANLLLLAAASIDADKRISALRAALKDCAEMFSINYLRKRAQDALDKDTLDAR